MLLEELIEKAFSDGYKYALEEQREFGVKSKLLGAFASGAYQAKEAAKYGYSEDEYKKKRAGYALKGLFTPLTATVIKKKVEKMEREGKSRAEIRKFLENAGDDRIMAGIGEAFILNGTGLGSLAAKGVGLVDAIDGNRKKFK